MSNGTRGPQIATESIPGRRDANEDSLLVHAFPDGRILLAVADGMGGHAAGEVASALALEGLRESLEAGGALTEGFLEANERVFASAREPGKLGMGTTLVAVLVEGDEFVVANVGDSRCYLLSGREIRRLTRDHSFVAEAVKRGQSEEEAMSSRWRDALTRSVGTDVSVEADLFGPFPVEPDSALLLCSDGLYKTLPDPLLLEVFRQAGTPEGSVRTLVRAAYERGSDDNISVVVAEWGTVPRNPLPEEEDAASGTSPEPPLQPRSSPPEARKAPRVVGSPPTTRLRPSGTVGIILAMLAAAVAYLLLR